MESRRDQRRNLNANERDVIRIRHSAAPEFDTLANLARVFGVTSREIGRIVRSPSEGAA